jgi:hypothetical protein
MGRKSIRTGELPHELLLRAGIAGELDGKRLSKHQRIDALKEATQYYTPAAFAAKIVRAVLALHHGTTS